MKIASGAALRASASRDVMEVHRMLAHPSEDITRKTAEMMGIETTGQWGACETCFQAKAKRHAVPKKTDEQASARTRKIVERQAVQWIDGPKKTVGDGTGSDDRGMKSAGDGTIVERGTPQLNVQELGQEQQPASSLELRKEVQEAPPDPERGTREAPPDPAEDTQEAPPNPEEETREVPLDSEEETWKVPWDPEKETREVPLDPEEETWKVPWDPEKETREVPLDLKEGTQEASPDPAEETWKAPSDREDEAQGTPSYPEEETLEAPSDPEKTKYAARLAEGPTDLEGPVVPASRKRTIGGNLPPNNLKAHVEPAGARRRGRKSTAKFSADERGRQRGECADVRRRGHDVLSEESGATGPDSEGHVTGAVNRQKTMNALEMEKWRKVRRKKWKVARPNDKIVVRSRMIYKTKMKDGEVEKYRCRLTA